VASPDRPSKSGGNPFSGGGGLTGGNRFLPVGIAILATVFLLGTVLGGGPTGPEELSYSAFVDRVEAGEVDAVTLRADGVVEGTFDDDGEFRSNVPTSVEDPALLGTLEDAGVEVDAAPAPQPGLLASLLVNLLPFVLIGGLLFWWFRRASQGGGGMNPLSSMGRSSAKVSDTERPETRFSDVAGYDGVKREVSEVVDFLRNPEKYKRLGAKGPGGILLAGPPGTGKTLLARAVAGEAEVPFLSTAGSEFVEMLVGVGASRVRDLFKKAREMSPAIIFVDELDSLGRKRGGSNNIGANNEQEQTLNQLLAEMDGFDTTAGIVVIAATNRPEMLDDALTRPGRFDRQVEMGPPSLADRGEILELHARGKVLADDVDLERLARGTPGFTGAQLENLLNESALIAVREGAEKVRAVDVEAARDRIILGRRDESAVLTRDEQRRVAVHEAGHAIMAALRDGADPVSRVSILASGQALGVTHMLPLVEQRLHTETQLRHRIDVALGGRGAELVVLGEASSGAANDLVQATRTASAMVRDLGLSDRFGPVGYHDPSDATTPAALRSRPFSEDTQRALDDEVRRMLEEGQTRVLDDLAEHRQALEALVERLLVEEVLDGEVVYELVGRPVPQRPPMVGEDVDEDGHVDPRAEVLDVADDVADDGADDEDGPDDAEAA